jgi:hypothetical protein
MQHEATTSELVEILGTTRKSVALWSHHGVMVKTSYGRYDLKKSLQNWVAYQKCVHEGYANPLLTWQVRQEIAWSEAQPPRDVGNVELGTLAELVPLDLTFEEFEVELDAAGRPLRAGRAGA